jgi:N4-(beta-N-acetylglucosaminyl)-L-asparaginase
MISRRKFIQASAATSLLTAIQAKANVLSLNTKKTVLPIVISTWDFGAAANAEAFKILSAGGRALDAVEAGVKITESDPAPCGFHTPPSASQTLSHRDR